MLINQNSKVCQFLFSWLFCNIIRLIIDKNISFRDLIPIISALEYNTWFTKLRANQVKLSHDNIDRILHVLRKSLNLEELYLDNLGLKADFVNKLSSVLKLNLGTALHTIDISYNPIEDKGKDWFVVCYVINVITILKLWTYLRLFHVFRC